MHVVELPAGTVLIREGETGDAFYVLLEGGATVSQDAGTIAVIEAGDHFGELALLDPGPRDATVTAGTDVVVGVLGARAFNAIVRDVPGMNAKLLRALARRLREADLKSTHLPRDAGQRGSSSPST
jgi:CRP/FNR family transcriptional regulator, cyclic AMP receptor protein